MPIQVEMFKWLHKLDKVKIDFVVHTKVSTFVCLFSLDLGNYVLYLLVAVTSSGILKEKQNLGVTFNSNKLGVIDLKKKSKLTMCSA